MWNTHGLVGKGASILGLDLGVVGSNPGEVKIFFCVSLGQIRLF